MLHPACCWKFGNNEILRYFCRQPWTIFTDNAGYSGSKTLQDQHECTTYWSNEISTNMSFTRLISQGLRSTKPSRWFLLPTKNLTWLGFQYSLPSVETRGRGKEERPPLVVLVNLRRGRWEWLLITGLAVYREWLKGKLDVGLAHWVIDIPYCIRH